MKGLLLSLPTSTVLTLCRMLAKDTFSSFICSHLSVCPHTHTPPSTLTYAPPQKLSVPCRWNKSFSKGMLLSCAAKPHKMRFSHSTTESQVHLEFLWPVVVKCPAKQHKQFRGLWHYLQSQLQVSYHKPSIAAWLHKTKAEAVTPQNIIIL